MIPRTLRQKPGTRFAIRPYQPDDVAPLFAAADESREHLGQWMTWFTPDYSIENTADWVHLAIDAWDQDTAYEFVIIDTEDGTIAGSCALNEISRKYLMSNLGYWVRSSKRNLGAARTATELLWNFGLSELHLNRMEIVIAPGNQASRRVAEAVGAHYEGILRQRLRVGNTCHDALMYALLRLTA
jgi:RimJ/RimL family protein N-acetyltransferase